MKKTVLVVLLFLVLLLAVAQSPGTPAQSGPEKVATGQSPASARDPTPAVSSRPVELTQTPAAQQSFPQAGNDSSERRSSPPQDGSLLPQELPTEVEDGASMPRPVPEVEWKWHPAGDVLAPVLLYHHVVNKGKPARYAVSSEAFEAQMDSLQRRGYTVIPLSLLVQAITDGAELPPKPVVITFDDGYRDVYENALPILQQYGIKATVYVIVQQVGIKGYLKTDQLKELAAQGWEIGSHTVSHASLRKAGVDLKKEIESSRTQLEELLSTPVESFSFPYGLTSSLATKLVKEAGYTSAVGLGGLPLQKEKYLYYISRIEVQGGFDLADFNRLLP